MFTNTVLLHCMYSLCLYRWDIFKPETVHDVCTTRERQQIPPSLLSRNSEALLTKCPSASPR
jgi:hypothetical protein